MASDLGECLSDLAKSSSDLARSSSDAALLKHRLVPVTFRWSYGADEVFVAGTFSNWKLLRLMKMDEVAPAVDSKEVPEPLPLRRTTKLASDKEFFLIVDVPEGRHEYKFKVDGEWIYDPMEPIIRNPYDTHNNCIYVRKSDYETIEISDMSPIKYSLYGREIPKPGDEVLPRSLKGSEQSSSQDSDKVLELPRTLLYTVTMADYDPNLEPYELPEPLLAVVNHFYSTPITDGTFIFSATIRFRERFVTYIFLKKTDCSFD